MEPVLQEEVLNEACESTGSWGVSWVRAYAHKCSFSIFSFQSHSAAELTLVRYRMPPVNCAVGLILESCWKVKCYLWKVAFGLSSNAQSSDSGLYCNFWKKTLIKTTQDGKVKNEMLFSCFRQQAVTVIQEKRNEPVARPVRHFLHCPWGYRA